jgi:hypothetical protein
LEVFNVFISICVLFLGDFIELQPVSKYKEDKENKELGIDLTPNVDDGYVPLHTEEEEEEVYAPFEATILSIALANIRTSLDSS